MNVLVVDDVAINRRLLRATLEAEGHEVSEAADGVEALAMLEAGNFDSLISDILMPNMDGYRLCAAIRASARLCNLPFVFYTSSYTTAVDEKFAREIGASQFIRKPAPAQDIIGALTGSVTADQQRTPAVTMSVPEEFQEYSEPLITKLEQHNVELAAINEQLEREVRERSQARTAVRASEARFRQLLESLPQLIWTAGADGQIDYLSPQWVNYTGIPELEQLGEAWAEQLHPDDREHAFAAWNATLASKTALDVECRVRRKDGVYRWFRALALAFRDDQGRVVKWCGTNTDVDDQKQAEAERRALEIQLRQSQKMEALGTLAGGIAHDFNNILGIIIGNTELARQDIGSDHTATESLNEIRKASHRAKALVERIILFAGREKQRLDVVPLRPMVEEAVALLRATLPAGVELVTAFDTETPTVRADPAQIHRVLLNLCANAWHAMGGTSGRIDIHLDGITLDADAARAGMTLQPGRFARLSVTDNGSGMDAATLAHIFEPFFTTKPVGQGAGLGLSAVHGIMEAHGGGVTVMSQPDTGTSFSLYFPAAEAPAPNAIDEPSAVVHPPNA